MKKRFSFPTIASSEITSESSYFRRRQLMQAAGLAALPWAVGSPTAQAAATASLPVALKYKPADKSLAERGFYTSESLTPSDDISAYCNFYEFGTDKGDPAKYAGEMSVTPWSINVSGEVGKPGKVNLEDLLSKFDLEERIYRLRCVEAWSMVVPWVGIPLADVLARFEPTSKARFVEFRTLYDREQMRGTRSFSSVIDWPYREGLRLDEAMNPLAILAVGLYGKTLPNSNGAPLRLVVPWKYGFKSIKSIVSIRLSEKQPATSWQTLAPREYGFYANVNPAVDHPRWSQKFERRLPSGFFRPNRIETQPFNGYGEQVASLYKGMDLSTLY